MRDWAVGAWFVFAACAVANLLLTEVAYRVSLRKGGHPPRGRWNMGQFAFWRYIYAHGATDRAGVLRKLVLAACVANGIALLAFGALVASFVARALGSR